jgi:hypothetical protein
MAVRIGSIPFVDAQLLTKKKVSANLVKHHEEYGKLALVFGAPKGGDIFTVREREEDGARTIHICALEGRHESSIGHCLYSRTEIGGKPVKSGGGLVRADRRYDDYQRRLYPRGEPLTTGGKPVVFVGEISAQPGYEEQSVKQSLVAYLRRKESNAEIQYRIHAWRRGADSYDIESAPWKSLGFQEQECPKFEEWHAVHGGGLSLDEFSDTYERWRDEGKRKEGILVLRNDAQFLKRLRLTAPERTPISAELAETVRKIGKQETKKAEDNLRRRIARQSGKPTKPQMKEEKPAPASQKTEVRSLKHFRKH